MIQSINLQVTLYEQYIHH